VPDRGQRRAFVAGLILTTMPWRRGIAVWALRKQAVEEWRSEMSNYSLVLAAHASQTISSAYLVRAGIVDQVKAAGIRDAVTLRAKMASEDIHRIRRDRISSSPQIDVAIIVAVMGGVFGN